MTRFVIFHLGELKKAHLAQALSWLGICLLKLFRLTLLQTLAIQQSRSVSRQMGMCDHDGHYIETLNIILAKLAYC